MKTMVAAAVLALVVVPASADATFDPVGPNDFRISFMGGSGNDDYNAFYTSVAYNPTANEYLIAWSGDDDTFPLVDNEYEVFAQRLSATGAPLGGRIRVSHQGAPSETASSAEAPGVAYNSAANGYLVTWRGNIGTTSEYEIFGQRLSAAGVELGSDFQISLMAGANGNTAYDAEFPVVASNPAANEYLVVWSADDNSVPLADDEHEVFGQRLSGVSGLALGERLRISEQGADGNPASDAQRPSVAYNPTADQYLVAWTGNLGTSLEFEIWAQRLSATGAEVGGSDFRVSDMGPESNDDYDALAPSVAVNPAASQYLIVWEGDDNTGGLLNDEYEVFGQRLTATGAETGKNDFRISGQGPEGGLPSYPLAPRAAYSPAGQFLVVWQREFGNSEEQEIWAQGLSPTGAEVGGSDLRVSDMGADGDDNFDAYIPSVAAGSAAREYLIAWDGDDDASPLVDEEREIFGQRLRPERVNGSLTISYSDRAGAFKGKKRPAGPCGARERVTVLERRRGPDRRVGRDRTNARGRYEVPDAGDNGTYYAKAPGHYEAAAVLSCTAERSRKLRVRP